jgi:hypothetical protein
MMYRNAREDHHALDPSNSGAPSEAWLFAQAILGKPIPRVMSRDVTVKAQRAELERLAQFSSRHAQELRNLQAAESEARRDRELLEWAAQISTRAEGMLRELRCKEAEEREAWRRAKQFCEAQSAILTEWNEADHPRAAKGTATGGQWIDKDGGAGVGSSGAASGAASRSTGRQVLAPTTTQFQAVGYKRPARAAKSKSQVGGKQQTSAKPSTAQAKGSSPSALTRKTGISSQDAADPSRWYLPAEDKGTWAGKTGHSAFRLKTPIDANGKIVREIQYVDGVPVLDGFALPGKTATIILTGESDTDIRNAEAAWKRLNPGQELPTDATFHHDLLHATEETVTIDGKKTKVLVGKMHLIPTDVNKAVFHQGSASVARKYYQGLGADMDSIYRLASKEASLAATGGKIVGNAAKNIAPGKIAKGLRSLVGRGVVRLVPLVGTGLAIVDFAENAEAHGIGGALVRATPLLGDLVSAADLGSDLAKQITDEADAAIDSHTAALNAPVNQAWEKASQQTIQAYQELASQIKVTNKYGPNGLVDPEEIATALMAYRARMQQANFLRTQNAKRFDYDAAAADAKRDLRERLTKAAQKDSPPAHGPVL